MKIWKDCGIDNVNDIWAEGRRQVAKWGIQERSPFEWMAYLTEEVGELAKAIAENEYRNGALEDIEKEAVQVATLVIKMARMARAEREGRQWKPEPKPTTSAGTCIPEPARDTGDQLNSRHYQEAK